MLESLRIEVIGMVACFSIAGPANSEEVAFLDGMEVTVEGTLSVRAQSLGPGVCGVEFTAHQQEGARGNWQVAETITVVAPPLDYSDWQELYSIMGSAFLKITATQTCDTGFVAQLSYE